MESELENKADRAWGFYDSHTGEYSPDGFTTISSSNIMIAAGMAYQKTVTTDGEVWVLTATEPTSISGVTSNGFFRIEDGDGNALFEIIKGDKRTVGATAGSVSVFGNVINITYDVVSDNPPTIWCTTDLRSGVWNENGRGSS